MRPVARGEPVSEDVPDIAPARWGGGTAREPSPEPRTLNFRPLVPLASRPLPRTALALGAVLLLGTLTSLTSQWGALERDLNLGAAGLALALGVTYWLLGGVAWWRTLTAAPSPSAARAIPLGTALRIFYVGNLGRYLPGKLWYAAGRTYLGGELGLSRARVAVATVLELGLIVTSGAIITAVGTPFLILAAGGQEATSGVDPSRVGAAGVVAVVVGLLALHPASTRRALTIVAHRRGLDPPSPPGYRVMVQLLASYLGVWLIAGGALFATLAALTPVSWAQLPAVLGIWGVAYLAGFVAPLTPAGLGVREATAAALLAGLFPLPAALAGALLFRIVLTVAEAILVVPFLPRPRGFGRPA